MEITLSLKDGLARSTRKLPKEMLEMMASSLLIPLEYEKLESIPCPQCSSCDWERTSQIALDKGSKYDWPYSCPAGDKLQCQCKSCGHELEVTFWFTD